MNSKLSLPVLFLVGGLALVSGCATPEARIGKHPEVFKRLTAEQQQLVREGRIGLGFDMDTVKLALGDPDRIFERIDANGKLEIWCYAQSRAGDWSAWNGFYSSYPNYAMLRRGWVGFRDPSIYRYPVSIDGWQEGARDQVIFKDGRVISIEVEKKSAEAGAEKPAPERGAT